MSDRDEVDYFNLEPEQRDPAAASAAGADLDSDETDAVVDEAPRKRGAKFKTWHLMTGATVIGIALIVGINLPALSSGQSTPARRVQSGSVTAGNNADERPVASDPARAPAEQPPKRSESVPVAAPAAMPTTGTRSGADVAMLAGPVVGTESAPSPAASAASPQTLGGKPAASRQRAPASTAEVAELTESVNRTQQGITDLDGKLSALSKQVARLDTELQHRKPERRAPPRRKHATSPAVLSLSGEPYSIYYLGPGFAWLKSGTHLRIVQPGDRIGTVRVLAINPAARTVLTSAGTIR